MGIIPSKKWVGKSKEVKYFVEPDSPNHMGEMGKIISVLKYAVVIDFSPFSKKMVGQPQIHRIVTQKDYQIIIKNNNN